MLNIFDLNFAQNSFFEKQDAGQQNNAQGQIGN